MFTTDFETEIIALDAKIAEAKTYLKKLRQYKRLMAKIEAEKANGQLDLFEAPQGPTQDVVESVPDVETSPDAAPTAQNRQVECPELDDRESIDVEPFSPEVVEQPALALVTDSVANIAPPTTNDLDPAVLAELGIRELYDIARQHGIKSVKRKSKDQLIQELMAA